MEKQMTAQEALEKTAKTIQKDIKNGDFYLEEVKDKGHKCYTTRMKSYKGFPEGFDWGGHISIQKNKKSGEQYLDVRGGMFWTLIYARGISFYEEQEVREILFNAVLEKEQEEQNVERGKA